MFQLFLVNLIKSGADFDMPVATSLPPKRLRNRRIYERYTIDHKHLALMNDQDILLVRDLSEGGFCTEVSERAFRRLTIGDLFVCRLRYLGEIYRCEAQVAWKSKNFVGFELRNTSADVDRFMSRLLTPLRIGTSLKPIDEKLARGIDNEGMLWYQGEDETNLYIWPGSDDKIGRWTFIHKERYTRWDNERGLQTGTMLGPTDLAFPWNQKEGPADKNVDLQFRQETVDTLMALASPHKEQLIASLTGDTNGI